MVFRVDRLPAKIDMKCPSLMFSKKKTNVRMWSLLLLL